MTEKTTPEGSPPSHKEIIEASWYRCESYGLSHGSEPDFGEVRKGDVSSLIEQHNDLVSTTENEVLPYYENILSNSSCMIVLADNRGHVLNTWGSSRSLGRAEHGLLPGHVWREEGVGTNAIGTALQSGQAIQVSRDEHFLRANRFMAGSASPIYDTRKSLIGVLDISTDAYLPQDHTLGLVKLMSLSVENQLIYAAFQRDHYILTFNTNTRSLESHWSGLVVLDESGTIVSANRRASIMLSCDLALMNVEELFGCRLQDLKLQPASIPLSLLVRDRYRVWVRVQAPLVPTVSLPDFRSRPGYKAPDAEKAEPDGVLAPLVPAENRLSDENSAYQERLASVGRSAAVERPASGEGPLFAEKPAVAAVSGLDTKAGLPRLPEGVIPFAELEHGDRQMQQLLKQTCKIIEKDIPILIRGETGAGKEVLVRSLHYHSQRCRENFIAVNCASIPVDLVESELFGYEKGAFTGAHTKGYIGLIRRAHKGTLFLDEIGEMPMHVQSRLLRVLQERVVTPLGSTESFAVDIRLVSATNRNLKQEIERGNFRQDLYYRIAGLSVELPALRDRQDKRPLIDYIFTQLQQEYQSPGMDASVRQQLYAHHWPGNIRQLVSVLKVALAMSDDEVLQQEHLPLDFVEEFEGLDYKGAGFKGAVFERSGFEAAGDEEAAFAQVNPADIRQATPVTEAGASTDLAQLIPQLYIKFGGNVSKTARAAGVSRNTVYKYLPPE